MSHHSTFMTIINKFDENLKKLENLDDTLDKLINKPFIPHNPDFIKNGLNGLKLIHNK